MDTKHITLLALAALALCACKSEMPPSQLDQFIAKVDAETAAQVVLNKNKKAKVAPALYISPSEPFNVLYNPNGTILWSGQPAMNQQTVSVAPNGQISVVDDIDMANKNGNYVVFTPNAIYVLDMATGNSQKIARTPALQGVQPGYMTNMAPAVGVDAL